MTRSGTRTSILFFYLFVMLAAKADANALTIGLIGDSTVASTYGWGPAFADQVSDQVTVLNYAKNGATLLSLSKKLDVLLQKKPDYVIIQFGHNDMKHYDAEAYGEKLKGYVARIKKAGSKPIIFSSVTRRRFDENGKISPAVIKGRTLHSFALSAKSVAEKTGSPFLDLNSISIQHHNKIGQKESATYDFAPKDQTHFSKKGAKETAALIVKELKKVVPELVKYLE